MRSRWWTNVSMKKLVGSGIFMAIAGIGWLSILLLESTDDYEYMATLANRNPAKAVGLLKQEGIDAVEYGNKLLMMDRADLAVKWYHGLTSHYEEPLYLLGRAEALMHAGNIETAKRDCEYIFTREDVMPIVVARTHFVYGSVQQLRGDLIGAEKEYLEGLSLFKQLGKSGGQYLCLIELGQLYALQLKYEQALATMEEALAANNELTEKGLPAYSKGRYHEIVGNICYTKGDFGCALDEYIISEQVYRIDGETKQAEQLLAKVALLYYMTGKPAKAGEISNGIWRKYHNDPNNRRLMAYNNITLMMLDICMGDEDAAKARKLEALEWAEQSHDGGSIEDLMYYLESYFPCPEWR